MLLPGPMECRNDPREFFRPAHLCPDPCLRGRDPHKPLRTRRRSKQGCVTRPAPLAALRDGPRPSPRTAQCTAPPPAGRRVTAAPPPHCGTAPQDSSRTTVAFWEAAGPPPGLGGPPAGCPGRRQALAHRAPPGSGRRRGRHRPGDHLVRGRQAQRRLQLRGPPCRGGARGQGGPALRGRARRPPRHHLRRTPARGVQGRQRPPGPGHHQGRPRGHLPAGHPRNRRSSPSPWPASAPSTPWCSAASPPRR